MVEGNKNIFGKIGVNNPFNRGHRSTNEAIRLVEELKLLNQALYRATSPSEKDRLIAQLKRLKGR